MEYKDLSPKYSYAELQEIMKQSMSAKRYHHVLRVEETARDLAKHYHCDLTLTSLAALLHDYGKERNDEDYLNLIKQNPQYVDLIPYGNNIWHGILGAELVRTELGITNEEILRAIKVHTTGAVQMSLLDKIIFIADYIEPGREFPGVEEARKLAFTNLDEAIAFATKHTLEFLIAKEHLIYPETINVYNRFVVKGVR